MIKLTTLHINRNCQIVGEKQKINFLIGTTCQCEFQTYQGRNLSHVAKTDISYPIRISYFRSLLIAEVIYRLESKTKIFLGFNIVATYPFEDLS